MHRLYNDDAKQLRSPVSPKNDRGKTFNIPSLQSQGIYEYNFYFFKFAMPITSNQNNKHMGYREECKFSDDNFTNFTKTLQQAKGFRHVSFNPFTGMSTEGSAIRECSI